MTWLSGARREPRFCVLLIESEIHDVVVLHQVILQFEALFAGALRLRLAAGLDEVREADDLGADEALLDVRVDGPGGFPRGQAGADGPSAVFFSADGEETEVTALLERP